jgi:hypothetical protein
MNNGNAMYPGNSTDTLLNPLVAKNIVYVNSLNPSSVILPLLNYTSSIESTISNPVIRLQPNPANTACFYQLNTEINIALTIKIYDLAGRLVQAEANLSESGWINIADLEDGIYTVIVSDGLSQYTEKLIKQSN